jgi:multidrug efflux pump subunit AcrB
VSGFNLSALAVRERAVTLFFIVAIAIAGAFAFLQLGRAEDPAFTVKVLTVTVAWPGATADDMQNLVTEPLEKRLQELAWYDRVETVMRPGLAFMTLTLRDDTPPATVSEQFYQARKKLGDEARNLPSGALGPFVNDEYADVTFALYALRPRACRCGSWCGRPRRSASNCCMCLASTRSTSWASGRSGSSSSSPMPAVDAWA